MKKFFAVLLAGAMTISMAACGNGGNQPASSDDNNKDAQQQTQDTPKAEEPQTEEPADAAEAEPAADVEPVELNVAYMPNYASLWSVLTAMDQGYFEEEGITIKLWEFADGPSEIAAMEGGSIDLAYIGHGAHKLCINGQATIFAPSSVHGAPATAGLTMDDIEAYEMDATNMVAAMNSGTIDACTTWNPYSYQILSNNEDAKEIEFATDSVNLSSWICLPSYAEENRDVLVRFSRALYKAMQYSSQPDNMEYAVGLYAEQCAKDKEACMVETGDATWFSADMVKEGIEDQTMQNYYTRQQEMFIESGDVEGEVPLENYVLFDVMKEALAD